MEIVYFNEKTVREFYKSFSKGSNSKDYEFLVSIVLCKFLEKQSKDACIIGYKLKSKYSRLIPKRGRTSIYGVYKILKAQVDDDTDVDVIITNGTVDNIGKRSHAFQLKRFGRGYVQGKDLTNDLIKYLNDKIPTKYVGGYPITLLIVLEGSGMLDMELISKSLKTDGYPFKKIMFMCVKDKKLYIGEFWPSPGMDIYDPSVFLKNKY